MDKLQNQKILAIILVLFLVLVFVNKCSTSEDKIIYVDKELLVETDNSLKYKGIIDSLSMIIQNNNKKVTKLDTKVITLKGSVDEYRHNKDTLNLVIYLDSVIYTQDSLILNLKDINSKYFEIVNYKDSIINIKDSLIVSNYKDLVECNNEVIQANEKIRKIKKQRNVAILIGSALFIERLSSIFLKY